MSTVERRRHARFPFERDLEVWTDERLEPMIVRAYDISESGFSFVTDRNIEVGEHLVLGLKDVDDFLVQAKVRNIRPVAEGYIVGAERLGHA